MPLISVVACGGGNVGDGEVLVMLLVTNRCFGCSGDSCGFCKWIYVCFQV